MGFLELTVTNKWFVNYVCKAEETFSRFFAMQKLALMPGKFFSVQHKESALCVLTFVVLQLGIPPF